MIGILKHKIWLGIPLVDAVKQTKAVADRATKILIKAMSLA